MNPACPTCKKEVTERISGVWPFCSERCKQVDFGKWAQEDYKLPVKNPDTDELAEALEDAGHQVNED